MVEKLKKFWEKVVEIWKKVVAFKGTKYIVVLGIAAIVFIIVIVNSNAIFVLEASRTENGEKVAFIAVENKDYCYKGSELATGKGDDYTELWYVVEGYKDKASFEKGEAALFNSDTTKETFYDGKSSVVPYHFSNENITSNRAKGVQHRITTVVRRVQTEETRADGTTYTKTTSYRPTVWYELDKSSISKLESYTYSTFIELTKYQQAYNVNYLRITFKLDDTNTKFFRDFEI